MSVAAFPLSWPEGWARTPSGSRKDGTQFSRRSGIGSYGRNAITLDYARRTLADELDKLRAQSVTMSSNVPLRADGAPHSGSGNSKIPDPGVAIYFMLKGRQMIMAQDLYQTPAANFRSLALAVDALRSLERHGGGAMMGRAFDGFAALPPPSGQRPKRPWWTVMRFPESVEDREFLSAAEVEARFRTLSKKFHPDAGGTDEAFSELTVAKSEALEAIENGG